MNRWTVGFLLLFSLASCLTIVEGDEHTNTYQDGEDVVLWANKVGPYHNPSETYPYYSIPGCPQLTTRPLLTQPDNFGLLLEGDTLTDTGISFHFKREELFTKVCELKLTDEEIVKQLEFIVRNHYWYHLLVDQLPIFGMIGEFITEQEMKLELEALERAAKEAGVSSDTTTTPKAQGFIYTHRDFSISYNGQQIIEVNLTSENPRPIVLGETYPFTYSVTWTSTSNSFESRFNRYLDYDFFEHQIHWFSIMNSFMLVVFLCGLVLLILSRTVKSSAMNDKFLDAEAGGGRSPNPLDALGGEEVGWKLLVGDVFRAPPQLLLFSVLLGTGVQLLLLILAALVLALAVTYYDEQRGALLTCFLFFYSVTSGIQGYISGWYYKLHGGLKWKQAMWISAALYPGFLLTVLVFLNLLADTFGSHGILSGGTTFMITLVWVCVSVPLTIAGTIYGRAKTQPGAFPCRVNAIKRMIPSDNTNGATPSNPNSTAGNWYTNYYLLILMSGVLPFGSIFIEMYFIFTSFWNYKFYYVYGFMFLVFLILLIVTVCVSIVSSYILLNSEDYRWHWLSFFSSASSSIYIALYSIYYFYFETHMEGMFQTAYYFSTVTVVLVTFSLLTGAVGALGTRFFITKIYSYTKAD